MSRFKVCGCDLVFYGSSSAPSSRGAKKKRVGRLVQFVVFLKSEHHQASLSSLDSHQLLKVSGKRSRKFDCLPYSPAGNPREEDLLPKCDGSSTSTLPLSIESLHQPPSKVKWRMHYWLARSSEGTKKYKIGDLAKNSRATNTTDTYYFFRLQLALHANF